MGEESRNKSESCWSNLLDVKQLARLPSPVHCEFALNPSLNQRALCRPPIMLGELVELDPITQIQLKALQVGSMLKDSLGCRLWAKLLLP